MFFMAFPLSPSSPSFSMEAETKKEPPLDLFEHFEKAPSANIENIARGVYQIGKVRVDQVAGTVIVTGIMNAPTWMDIEFLAVAEQGKDHESLLIVEAEPFHINLACILLGLTGRVPVSLWIEWKTEAGPLKRVPAEAMIWDREKNSPMKRSWVYTGSRFDDEGRFLSQLSRSVVATYPDPDALIDHRLKGGGEFHRYGLNEKALPPQGTPVSLIIERVPPEKGKEGKRGKRP